MKTSAAELAYDRSSHAAAWTEDYVFHQLIPYIGNKRKLLGLIAEAIAATAVRPRRRFWICLRAAA